MSRRLAWLLATLVVLIAAKELAGNAAGPSASQAEPPSAAVPHRSVSASPAVPERMPVLTAPATVDGNGLPWPVGRNPFQPLDADRPALAPAPPPPPPPPIAEAPPPVVQPISSPPRRVQLTAFGQYRDGSVVRALVATPSGVAAVAAGDSLLGQYRVLTIDRQSVALHDTSTGSRLDIPLPPLPDGSARPQPDMK